MQVCLTLILVFLETHCSRFFLKTLRYFYFYLSGPECENLKSFLSDYINHLQKYSDTLLPSFLGLYTFEKSSRRNSGSRNSIEINQATWPLSDSGQYTFILTANIFAHDLVPNRKFDFKGATVGRHSIDDPTHFTSEADSKEYQSKTLPYKQKDTVLNLETLKELDFKYLFNTRRIQKFQLGGKIKGKIMKQLQNDTELLKKHKFMDYSLLIGVHDLETAKVKSIRPITIATFEDLAHFGGGLKKNAIASVSTLVGIKAHATANTSKFKNFHGGLKSSCNTQVVNLANFRFIISALSIHFKRIVSPSGLSRD